MKTFTKILLVGLLVIALGAAFFTARWALTTLVWERVPVAPRLAANLTRPLVKPLRTDVVAPLTRLDFPELVLTLPQNLQTQEGDKLVLGGTYTLRSGETLNGNLFILGGIATLEPQSRVTNDVALLGGTLQADGIVEGDIIALGGLVRLGETAQIEGDVNMVAGNISRDPGAQVSGSVTTGVTGPVSITVPGGVKVPIPGDVRLPFVQVNVNPAWEALWVFFRSLMWAALAVVVVLVFPKPMGRVGGTATGQAVVSGGLGLLTVVVLPIILVVVAITIIGIPVALLGVLALVVAWAFGIIALGSELGKRLASWAKGDWAPPLAAAVGTFLLTLVVDGVGKFLPCVGWLLPFLVGIVGLGAVLLTRFGSQVYPSVTPSVPQPAPQSEPLPEQTPEQVELLPEEQAPDQAGPEEPDSSESPPQPDTLENPPEPPAEGE